MIGERLRAARLAAGKSLAEIASKANVSVATLSRIETGKQSIDVDVAMKLARIVGIPAVDLFTSDDGEQEPAGLARRIAAMEPRDRTAFWRDLLAERRPRKGGRRGESLDHLTDAVDELLAQIDVVREELESLRRRVHARRK